MWKLYTKPCYTTPTTIHKRERNISNRCRIITTVPEENYSSHKTLTNRTTYPKSLSQWVVTFGECRHPGDPTVYNNTSQPGILTCQIDIFFHIIFNSCGSRGHLMEKCVSVIALCICCQISHYSITVRITVQQWAVWTAPVIRPEESVSVIIGAGQHGT